MAQNVIIELEDDLDGGSADETLTFALDGREYEIDLSDTNAQMLREALRPYAAAGHKATAGTGVRRKRTTGTTSSSSETARIRAWATEHGHPVSDRGRIHQHIRDAYYAATSRP
ncbi:Lsr2 family protein [Kocuria dechangensis]|uniref:Lsr2 family protein n=1 Tax=Kocuria dechangensis TaxID=1176249 RepID=A0A917LW46_9MICC|nr:Lsr2 family protein [Kocuria dechangensis]GGG60649.1 Lsr2 family protein [Kocuria dechangensis]